MIIYILKSTSCLALLLFFYHIVLEKEKMHNFNRFYLLGSILFSFLAPLATFTIYIKQEIIATKEIFIQPTFIDNSALIIKESYFDYTQILIGFYYFISAVFLLRFSFNLFRIIKKISLHKKVQQNNATLVLVDDKILPHTFWSYIFLNKTDYENGKIEEEIFTHELTHVTEKHTFDVLIIELLQAIFWINPFFIFLKKAMQLNHEFLADENVINQHKNTFHYQHLLLNKAAWNNEYYLASNLNYSLTKKRLKMMTTESSHSIVLLKKLAVIPVLTGFIFLFANRVEAQTNTNITTNELKEYNTLSKIFNEAPIETRIIKLKDLQKLELLYSKLTDKEKEKAEHFPESYFPDESIIELTKKLKKIIEKIGKKYNRNSYDELNKLYESKRNQVPHFIKSSKKRQEDLSNQYYELESLYFRLSKADKKKAKRPILPHDPYLKLKKNNKVFYKLRNNLTEEDKLLIPPPPPAPNASKEEILRAKKAYSDWKIRSGNDNEPLPPPPPPKKN